MQSLFKAVQYRQPTMGSYVFSWSLVNVIHPSFKGFDPQILRKECNGGRWTFDNAVVPMARSKKDWGVCFQWGSIVLDGDLEICGVGGGEEPFFFPWSAPLILVTMKGCVMLGFQIVEGMVIFSSFTGKCCFCFPSSLNFSHEIYSTKLLLICKLAAIFIWLIDLSYLVTTEILYYISLKSTMVTNFVN